MAAASTHDEIWTTRRRLVEDLLLELRERTAACGDARPVQLIETHISWVLLGPGPPFELPWPGVGSVESDTQDRSQLPPQSIPVSSPSFAPFEQLAG